ncbi:AIR synthase family protein [Defluviitalea phaphyphila]|uniref:AIR synthase family protein n=1 Tax=Defluviitalea phaphyphila TaxID=1473580 RepID=UPI000731E318|nr:AIR synthase family protein [Defluviitalea phaphyphila]
MKIGKVPSSILNQLVFENIKNKRNEIILRAGIGEDCSAIDLQNDEIFLTSTDPITGASEDIGYLGVHISCNDIASSGGEPIGVLLTILLPEDSLKEQLNKIMKEAERAAKEVNIEIIGGHTEITDAVNRPVISTTAIGKVKREKLISTNNAKLGQDIIMTKWAGLEGTTILAKDFEKELSKKFSKEFLNRAKNFSNFLSVVPEGIIAREHGATSMHDVTEGGILGAIWEIAEASGVGVELYLDKVPVKKETVEICKYFDISPYKLISSGSMIISSYEGEKLVNKLKDNNIEAEIIGKITEKDRICIQNGTFTSLKQPDVDDLYKAIKNKRRISYEGRDIGDFRKKQ